MSKFPARRPAKGRRPDRERQSASIGVMEQTLDEMYETVAQQVREYLYIYHMEQIEPRLKRLEMVFFRRWWYDLRPLRNWVKSKFQKKIEEPTEDLDCSCGAEPEHATGRIPECKFIMGVNPDADTNREDNPASRIQPAGGG